jgi:hypothetical protein
MNKKQNNLSQVLKIVIVLSFFSIVLILIFLFFNRNNSVIDSTVDNTNINFNPPTENEQKAGDLQKEEIINEEENPSVEYAKVIIVDASQYENIVEVRAFVSNVIKDGSCKFTFSKKDQSFSTETPAKADASTTTCITNDVSIDEFSESGVWEVEVTYTSDGIVGSKKSTVEVSI